MKKTWKMIGLFWKAVVSHKKIGAVTAVLAVILQLALCPVLVQADVMQTEIPEVNYNGKEQSIVFENTEQTDLFLGFKDLMPGDVREQKMMLKAKNITHETSFYLKAECDEQTKEILKNVQMDLYVGERLVVENGLIFDGVKLGTVSDKTTLDLTAVLKIPASLGNEVEGENYKIKWCFTAQEDGKEIVSESLSDQNNDAVQTGDKEGKFIGLYLAVCGMSFIVVVIRFRKNCR
jgi:hypothetical protein